MQYAVVTPAQTTANIQMLIAAVRPTKSPTIKHSLAHVLALPKSGHPRHRRHHHRGRHRFPAAQ